jgi:hypothetical protein
MKTLIIIPTGRLQLLFILLTLNYSLSYATTSSGFYLPEPYEEVSLRYKSFNNLIVIPVIINGNLPVNLILDTGTRNIVLFGKRFNDLFLFASERNVQFSGMGSGKPMYGKVSLGNKVELTSLVGERIPIVIVPNKSSFITNPKIDGIIGYDIFQKFEVEINPQQKKVTFRSSFSSIVPPGFVQVPMRIENTKPIIDSKILLESGVSLNTNLMIDTGSQLSVLLKTTNEELLDLQLTEVIGVGMSGQIEGINTVSNSVALSGINFRNQPTGIILSPWHNYGSLGMGTLKDYVLIINYMGAYACLKKL